MQRALGIFIAGLLVAGCFHHKTDETQPVPEDTPVQVVVINNYTLPVTVTAVGGGTSYRMGTVNPGLNSTFTLRQAMIGKGTVEFLADPNNGDPPFRSGALLLAPGVTVDIQIEQHLLNSSAVIRP